jgi:hypothetical protein
MKTKLITNGEPVTAAPQSVALACAETNENRPRPVGQEHQQPEEPDPADGVQALDDVSERTKRAQSLIETETQSEELPPRSGSCIFGRDASEEDLGTQLQPECDNEPSGLNILFKKLRRFKRTPPIEDVVLRLVAAGAHQEEAEQLAGALCAIFGKALELCGGDRQAAAILTPMEYRSRCGERSQCDEDISTLTSQRHSIINACLERLLMQGLVGRRPYASWQYELTNPILSESQGTACALYADPIDLLRLADEELKALPANDARHLMVWAILTAARERLAKEEAAIQSEIAKNQVLIKETTQLLRDNNQRLCEREQVNLDLRAKLSDNAWAKRHPLGPKFEPAPRRRLPHAILEEWEEEEEEEEEDPNVLPAVVPDSLRHRLLALEARGRTAP